MHVWCRGDTAVYLLFAYARVASILRKANDERGFVISKLSHEKLAYNHPAERALIMDILSFNDVIHSVLLDLMPNRLCDFLKEISVKFSDFVTKCQVLNSDEVVPRLILCECTKRVMDQCFSLLGIETLERI